MPQPSKGTNINLEKKEQFKEDPKLYFPTKLYNGFEFMGTEISQIDYDYIKSFNSCRMYEQIYGSQYFWEKFKNSKEITIIDKYLSEKELNKIIDIIEHWESKNLLTDQIKFLSIYLYKPKIDKETKKIYKKIKEMMNNKFQIYSTKNEYEDLIHDRFAILDEETFHFGGTVGGYQQGFTAFSCGWSDKNIMMLFNYFKNNNLIYEVKNL